MDATPLTHWPASSGAVKFEDMEDSHILSTINYVRWKAAYSPKDGNIKTAAEKKYHLLYLIAEAKRRGLVQEDYDQELYVA